MTRQMRQKKGPRTQGRWQALLAVSSLAGALAGCGAGPELTGDTAPGPENRPTRTSIDPRGHARVPIRTAGGTVHYYGGPVIPNPKVYAVWWGDPARLNPAITAAHGGIADFFAGATNSNFLDWWSEYNTNITVQAGSHTGSPGTNQLIGRGNYAGAITLTAIPAGNVTDAQVQSALTTAFAAHALPQPDDNTIYAIYFPSSVSINLGGSVSCLSFGAYHEAVVGAPQNAYYLVMPDCGDSFNGTTIVTAHELAEAMTDGEPTPGSSPDYPQAWNDAGGNEVGDLCEGSSGTITTPTGPFQVQGIWDERSLGCKVTTTAAQDFSVAISPNTATQAAFANGTFSVQTATTAGAAEALTLSVSAPAGVTASISPATLTSGATATLSVSAASALANVQVVVRADGAAGTHTAALLLNVTGAAGNDFSVNITAPTSQTVTSGASAVTVTFPITTAVTAGVAESVSLSVSGLSGGVTGAFSPASVTAGGASTLTLTVPAHAAASTSNFTVTGTSPSATHTAAGTLTVVTGVSGGITNGDFETGTLSGWTASGASTGVVNMGAHGGTFAARLGNTTATNGNSSIAQTFTVPAGVTSLSFWYKITCPDTVAHDWATATLRDNRTGRIITVLPRTCATTSWVQVSSAVIAGHSVTLKLTSHDDNSAGDPTYTLYDDVTLH